MSQPQGAEAESLAVATSTTFEAVTVLLSLLLIAFSTKIIKIIAPHLIRLVARRSSNDIALEASSKELAIARKELLAISPVAEFAKYAKKKREVDALDVQVKQYSSNSSSKSFKLRIAVQIILYAVVYFFTLRLLYNNYGIAVTVVDSKWFYPLNWLISFPGCSSNEIITGVSVQFILFMIMTATWLASFNPTK